MRKSVPRYAALFVLVCAGARTAASQSPSSSDDGAWLEKEAEKAVVAGAYPRAVALLRGLSALRQDDAAPHYRLAEVWTLAGQYEEAIAEYRRYLQHPHADPARRARVEAEVKRLEEAPAPFSESLFRQHTATAEAKRLFDLGKKNADEKRWPQAVGALQAAMLLDPDLPGPYRLLGAVYGKTGDHAEERRFLADYLRVRPDGKIADTVRATLKKEGVLGTLNVDASFPCKVWVNGRETGRTTPLRGFLLPSGKYVVGLENERYHIVRNLRVEVQAGQETERRFNFGVLTTKLDPWARVRVDGKDIGLWDEAGVPEGKHQVTYKSHDGAREKTVELEIRGGAHERLSW
jgi:tetratricopeptide (TPR) repeat protein